MLRSTTSIAGAAMFLISNAHASIAPPVSASKRQTVILKTGKRLTYTAQWNEAILKDAGGAPEATISGIAYTLGRSGKNRPVFFIFNGGPGASSSPLHFGLAGPLRMESKNGLTASLMPGTDEPTPLVFARNDETLLDASDIVLIDPVGTGFSQELREQGGRPYWSPDGDIRATEAFIRDWLKREGRTDAPIYLMGESYGGFRAGLLAGRLTDLDVRGVVLISPGLDMRLGTDLDYIALVPSLATAALAQGRVPANGRTVRQVFDEAQAFATGAYASALQKGMRLDASAKDRIATQMAALTGMSKDFILSKNLRVKATDFVGALVPEKLVSMLDSRVSSALPKKAPGRDNASSDPMLAMGASNVKTSPDIAKYLRDQANAAFDRPYVSLSLDVNFDFNWQPGSQTFEANGGWVSGQGLVELVKQHPSSRILVTAGYYDLATPAARIFYDVDHLDIPARNVDQLWLESGHGGYSTPEARGIMSDALHRLIASTSRN